MPMTPLGALIVECQGRFQDKHGVELTLGDIIRRSRGALGKSRVQQLRHGEIKAMPTPATIRGLALGLDVPESVVLERALQSAGYLPAPFPQGAPDATPIADPEGAATDALLQAEVERHPATQPAKRRMRPLG
jgi:hypothetical protein